MKGVWQGCVLSPDVFNLFSGKILREASYTPELVTGGYGLNNIPYADDTALVAESTVELQNFVDRVVEESKKGLAINCKKTECMVVSKKKSIPKCSISINNETMKQVENFNYLGSLVTSNDKIEAEIQSESV